jgi:hypothetical protein
MLHGAVDGVAGAGLPRPPPGASTGAALVRIELSLHASLAAAYVLAPPFVASSLPSVDVRARERPGGDIAMELARARLLACVCSVPSLVRLCATRPWSAGGALLFLAGWLAFACPPPAWPWWLLTAWSLNGGAMRALESTPSAWEPSTERHASPPPQRFQHPHNDSSTTSPQQQLAKQVVAAPHAVNAPPHALTAEERLARLDAALQPLLEQAAALAAVLERAVSAPAAFEPRATALLALPVVLFASVASAVLEALWWMASLVGGGRVALFGVLTLVLLLNALAFHRAELYTWLGTRGDRLGDDDDERAADGDTDVSRRLGPPSGPPPSPPVVTFASGSMVKDIDDPSRLFNSERRTAASSAVTSVWRRMSALAANLLRRLPDAPTQAHRAMARAALQPEHGDHHKVTALV